MKRTHNGNVLLAGLAAGAVFCTTLPARADYSTTVLGLNPLAYYRLNETTPVPPPDIATNLGTLGANAVGYYIGSPAHSIAGGLVGSQDTATFFDGSGARLVVPYNPALGLNPPFTVEAWVNPAVAPPPDTQSGLAAVLSFGHLADPRSGWLIYQSASGWNLRMYNQNGTATSVNITGGPAPVGGTWYHIAAVYDGTTAQVFVNGVSAASGTPTGFVPSTDGAFTVGSRSDINFHYNGTVDEVALYTNALSGAELLAHYQNGISASPSQPYNQLVLAQHPTAYFRLNEPLYTPPDPSTLPVAANVGSLGAAANGTTQPGCETGVAGPPYSGLGVDNHACLFSGVEGYIDCGATGFDISGPITVMAWVKVNRFDKTWESIVTKGDSSWRVHRSGDTPNLGFGTTGLSNVDQTGTRVLNDGQWHHLVALYDGTTKRLYVDSVLDSSIPVTGTLALNTYSVFIGENSQVTGRFFNGVIDEVAIFTNALTATQIQQVYNSGNVPPVIAQQPQAPSGTIIAGSPVTLSVVAAGTPVLGYQWLREGTNLPAQTTTTLSFSNIRTNDSGNYAVVVTNLYGSITSAVVALNVTFPTSPAALARASGYPVYNPATQTATLTQVILEFSGPLAAEGSNPAHYSIPGLTVSAAQFTNLNTTVILTTSPQTQGATYTVTVTGVTDGIGNPLAVNTAPFRAWISSPGNGITFEYFPSEGTASPSYLYTDVGALTNNSLYPDYPVLVTNLWSFDSRVIFPDDTHERYGARMRGVFVPPASGYYRFYLRSDDASQVFLNPNGPDAAGRQLILNEPACCGDWNKYASAAFPLTVGESYYLEMLYKEGGGGDYGKVAALLVPSPTVTNYPAVGTPNTSIDPASLTGPMIGYPYAPADVGGALILAGPTNVTVQANHPVTFTVAASNAGGWPMSYQWRRNGAPIADATDSSYSLMPAAGDNGAQFTVQVSKLGSVVVSSQAVLSVQADTDAPAIAAAHGSEALNTVTVSFSELMGTPAASSFTIAGFTTTAATLDATGTNVVLTFDHALTPGQSYTITVQNVQDSAGTPLANATVPVRAFFLSRGLLKFDYFGGLSDSDNVLDSTLVADPRFPDSPTLTGFLTAMDTRTIFPDDSHSGYGALVHGVFIPPTNGNYAFFLKSDDSSRFYLNSTGSDPIDVKSATPFIEETACCHSFADLGNTNGPLTAGQMYAIAAYYKEGNGGDYMQIAEKPETDTTPPNNLYPAGPAVIGVLVDPVGASVTITQQPVNYQAVYVGGAPPATVMDLNFSTGDGSFTVVNYLAPPGPWSYNAVSGSWTNFGPDSCTPQGPYATGLTSPNLTLATNGSVILTFSHRYSFEQGNFDMGQVRVSLNGGPFATVPALNFQQNGYVGTPAGTIEPSVAATPGFINAGFLNESLNYASGGLITSVAYLGSYKAGDVLKIQFLANWDECSQGTPPNWEIKSVKVTVGGAPPLVAHFHVGAESMYQNQPNAFMSYFWQVNRGSGFVDIPGLASSPDLDHGITFADNGNQYRAVVYGPGAAATSTVATLTVTMPLSFTRTTANTITLTWPLPPAPAPLTTFVLEQAATLNGTWTQVNPSTYQTTSTSVSVSVTIQPGANQFYRLRRT